MKKEKLNEWVELPIEQILATNAKGAIIGQGWSPQCEKGPSTSEKDWGVLKTTAIQPGNFLDYENKKLPVHLEPKTQHEVKKGDLLITCAGPRNRCGIVCLVRKTRKRLMISGKMYRFRIDEEKATPDFIEAFLLSQKAWKEIDKMKTGISDSGLNLTHGRFRKLLIPIPSITTQLTIVAKIEELFSEIENGIKSLFTAKEQLKKYRQSVLKWAFEGKLTNGLNGDLYDLPDEHDLSIAAEPETEYRVQRNHNNQKNRKNHSSDKGELPEGWKWVKTIDVIHVINNGYTPTKEFLSEGVGEIPFIKVYNLNFNGTLNFQKNPTFIPDAIHKKDLKRSICFPGDVLINIVGPPLGKVSVVSNQFPQWNINQAIVMFRPNEKVISKYISYFMQNPVTINWLENTSKATAGQWNVKVSTCREIPFPFCSKVEQQKIVEAIESRLSVADKMEESITRSLQHAEALKQSILKKAFEGKLI